MTTAFQYVFDEAESIGFNRRAVTAQTISRDNTVRTVSRGGQLWRFDVRLPDGIRWSEARPYIEAIDHADRYTIGTVSLNNPGYTSYLINYLGNSVNKTGFVASFTQGATAITLTSSPTTTTGFKFRVGDVIQLGTSGSCYSVVADVAFNSNTVSLNRAILDATGSASLRVAENVIWSLVCTEMPTWNIFARDQVSWSGSFVFYESRT